MWETKVPGRAASSSRNTIAKTLDGNIPRGLEELQKASSSGRVRVEGSEVKEGTGASESDFDIH